MKSEEFLAFASKVAILHPQPAGIRSAISRAYYAAFHGCVQLLRTLSIPVDARHGSVWIDYDAAPFQESRTIGQHLKELHSWRVSADYQLERTDVEEPSHAILCVETAGQVLSLVATLQEKLMDDETKACFIQSILDRRKLMGRR